MESGDSSSGKRARVLHEWDPLRGMDDPQVNLPLKGWLDDPDPETAAVRFTLQLARHVWSLGRLIPGEYSAFFDSSVEAHIGHACQTTTNSHIDSRNTRFHFETQYELWVRKHSILLNAADDPRGAALGMLEQLAPIVAGLTSQTGEQLAATAHAMRVGTKGDAHAMRVGTGGDAHAMRVGTGGDAHEPIPPEAARWMRIVNRCQGIAIALIVKSESSLSELGSKYDGPASQHVVGPQQYALLSYLLPPGLGPRRHWYDAGHTDRIMAAALYIGLYDLWLAVSVCCAMQSACRGHAEIFRRLLGVASDVVRAVRERVDGPVDADGVPWAARIANSLVDVRAVETCMADGSPPIALPADPEVSALDAVYPALPMMEDAEFAAWFNSVWLAETRPLLLRFFSLADTDVADYTDLLQRSSELLGADDVFSSRTVDSRIRSILADEWTGVAPASLRRITAWRKPLSGEANWAWISMLCSGATQLWHVVRRQPECDGKGILRPFHWVTNLLRGGTGAWGAPPRMPTIEDELDIVRRIEEKMPSAINLDLDADADETDETDGEADAIAIAPAAPATPPTLEELAWRFSVDYSDVMAPRGHLNEKTGELVADLEMFDRVIEQRRENTFAAVLALPPPAPKGVPVVLSRDLPKPWYIPLPPIKISNSADGMRIMMELLLQLDCCAETTCDSLPLGRRPRGCFLERGGYTRPHSNQQLAIVSTDLRVELVAAALTGLLHDATSDHGFVDVCLSRRAFGVIPSGCGSSQSSSSALSYLLNMFQQDPANGIRSYIAFDNTLSIFDEQLCGPLTTDRLLDMIRGTYVTTCAVGRCLGERTGICDPRESIMFIVAEHVRLNERGWEKRLHRFCQMKQRLAGGKLRLFLYHSPNWFPWISAAIADGCFSDGDTDNDIGISACTARRIAYWLLFQNNDAAQDAFQYHSAADVTVHVIRLVRSLISVAPTKQQRERIDSIIKQADGIENAIGVILPPTTYFVERFLAYPNKDASNNHVKKVILENTIDAMKLLKTVELLMQESPLFRALVEHVDPTGKSRRATREMLLAARSHHCLDMSTPDMPLLGSTSHAVMSALRHHRIVWLFFENRAAGLYPPDVEARLAKIVEAKTAFFLPPIGTDLFPRVASTAYAAPIPNSSMLPWRRYPIAEPVLRIIAVAEEIVVNEKRYTTLNQTLSQNNADTPALLQKIQLSGFSLHAAKERYSRTIVVHVATGIGGGIRELARFCHRRFKMFRTSCPKLRIDFSEFVSGNTPVDFTGFDSADSLAKILLYFHDRNDVAP